MRATRFAILIAFAAALNACSKAETTKAPVVQNVSTQTLEVPAAAVKLAAVKRKAQAKLEREFAYRVAGDVEPITAAPAVRGDVTFTKASLFDRLFLYGADLQYSSIGSEYSLLYQALAMGHVPARFQKVGSRLQMVTDLSYRFESDINTPSSLIHEWDIVAETETTISVTVRTASPTITTIVGGPKAPGARTSWVRSVEFVQQGDYLLIESSVEMGDGTIAEFMESVFPRETLVPADAKPLLADPALEPLARRYRFLAGDPVFANLPKGRTRTIVASRFPTPAVGKTIDWYVTPNVPAIYLPVIKAGVEGWNRYSQQSMGRDIVRFAGVMPAGMKIGDPRYNIINWDSVPQAGAAYESQATDPLTGLQSHSLVYLPYAWVNIGMEYWKRGGYSDDPSHAHTTALKDVMDNTSFLGQKLHKTCFHELELVTSLEARRSPEVFARELLKGVLFHEIGHAMGLAHNFKGSLSWNPNDASTPVTTSIMDYNQYQIEAGAFETENSPMGPLLEYDRQIMSVLYNNAKDVAATDAVLPACADAEADSSVGGVDPLCIRYDAGEDPTIQLHRTIALLKDVNAKVGPTQSLAKAILETRSTLGDAAAVTQEAEVDAKLALLMNDVLGVTSHYYFSGAQSLGYMTRANFKALQVARAGTVPAPYDANAMADRAFKGLQYVANLATLEPAAIAAIEQVRTETDAWLRSTAWFNSIQMGDKNNKAIEKMKAIQSIPATLEQALLPRVRQGAFAAIATSPTAPFIFSLETSPAVDYEQSLVEVLVLPILQPKFATGQVRPTAERISAATQLKQFAAAPSFAQYHAAAVASIQKEVNESRTATQRHELRQLLVAVRGF